MITIEQCRGARGILGWTQQDLADACGLSKTAINNFEKRHSDIKAESLKAIRMAFESAEIEFIGYDGLAKKKENTRILRGPTALGELIEDIHRSHKVQNNEILISNMHYDLAGRVSTQILFQHLNFIKTHNITTRIICTGEPTYNLSPEDVCHMAHSTHATPGITTFLYDGKVALELWDQSMILIIDSAQAYAAERDRFESLWAETQERTKHPTDTNIKTGS